MIFSHKGGGKTALSCVPIITRTPRESFEGRLRFLLPSPLTSCGDRLWGRVFEKGIFK